MLTCCLQQPEAAALPSPFQGALGKVGAGLVRLGEDLKGAGEQLGGVFVGLGNKLQGSMYAKHAIRQLCISSLIFSMKNASLCYYASIVVQSGMVPCDAFIGLHAGQTHPLAILQP